MFVKLDLDKILQTVLIDQIYEFNILDKKSKYKIIKKIDKIVKKHSIPGTNQEYTRAIGNASKHGAYPIKCSIYIKYNSQMICIIDDNGNGFDYETIVHQYQSNKVYYHNRGKGIRRYAENQFLEVDWKNQGKSVILYYNRNR